MLWSYVDTDSAGTVMVRFDRTVRTKTFLGAVAGRRRRQGGWSWRAFEHALEWARWAIAPGVGGNDGATTKGGMSEHHRPSLSKVEHAQ